MADAAQKVEIPDVPQLPKADLPQGIFNFWGGLFSFNYLLFKGYTKAGFKNLFLYAAIHYGGDQALGNRPHGAGVFILWFLLMGFTTNGIMKNYIGKGNQPSSNKSQNIFMVVVGVILLVTIFSIGRNI